MTIVIIPEDHGDGKDQNFSLNILLRKIATFFVCKNIASICCGFDYGDRFSNIRTVSVWFRDDEFAEPLLSSKKIKDGHDESASVCIFMTSMLVFWDLLEGYISTHLKNPLSFLLHHCYQVGEGKLFFVMCSPERLRIKSIWKCESWHIW